MEEIKFKIKHTEAANVEICPVEDGVEIIVKYGSKKPSYSLHTDTDEPQVTYKSKSKWGTKKSQKPNSEILKDFCTQTKSEEGINKKELLKFYEFYEPKMSDWKGTIQPEKLWERWMETAK